MIARIIVHFILMTISVAITAWLLSGITIDDFGTTVLVAVVLGLVNTFVKPIVSLIALPIILITFGLFMIVINTLLFWLVVDNIEGSDVDGFWWALLGSMVLTVVSFIISAIVGFGEKKRVTD